MFSESGIRFTNGANKYVQQTSKVFLFYVFGAFSCFVISSFIPHIVIKS